MGSFMTCLSAFYVGVKQRERERGDDKAKVTCMLVSQCITVQYECVLASQTKLDYETALRMKEKPDTIIVAMI